jgi:subtilisin-like proprotein convertase family protein
VVTTGYGDHFAGGGDTNQEYTATFGGTSSASALVAGVATALQGAQRGRGAPPLAPTEVRSILASTGSPQQPGGFSGNIGPRPDLRAAIGSLRDLGVTGVAFHDVPPLGNDDGHPDPGESGTLVLNVGNFGGADATGVEGALAAGAGAIAVTDSSATWPDLPSQADASSLPDHHRIAVAPGATCGQTFVLELHLSSDPYDEIASVPISIGADRGWTSADTPLVIPKKTTGAGVISSIAVADDFPILGVSAGVVISHGNIGELIVRLRDPDLTTVTLHNLGSAGTANLVTTYPSPTPPSGPGSMSDFHGQPSAGTWTLQVLDPVDSIVGPGTLASWTLSLTGCAPLSCGEPIPGPVDDSLRVDRSGAADLAFRWNAQAGAAAYRVWRSITPAFANETAVGQTAGTELVAIGEAGGDGLELFQVRALNACEWEGP